ncbi:MAG: Rha family transcriptional regulator [Rhodocyclaceae bacterium]|nr:Rha family transcriptional regulator [Rhodocyclaceae bacterium]
MLNPKEKPLDPCQGEAAQVTTIKPKSTKKIDRVEAESKLLVQHKNETLVDSRLIAKNTGVKHRSSMALVLKHQSHFERFGKVRFEIAPSTSGQQEKFALLTEDQAYFLLSLSRNDDRVVDLKAKLITAFRDVRLAQDLTKREYLPTYHALHDAIHLLAAQSDNEHLVHMNFNRLINKAVGIQPGTRDTLNLAQRSMLVVAQAVAANASLDASDHREGYTKAKEALKPLEAYKLIGGGA